MSRSLRAALIVAGATLAIASMAAVAWSSGHGAQGYAGPNYGIPFKVTMTGTVTRDWTIKGPHYACDAVGSGSQTVTFRTPKPAAKVRMYAGSNLDPHGNRQRRQEYLHFAKLVVTVKRSDQTTYPQTPSDGCDPKPPRHCGTATLALHGALVWFLAGKANIELDNGSAGSFADKVDHALRDDRDCHYPNPEAYVVGKVKWPGNDTVMRPHSKVRHFKVKQAKTANDNVRYTGGPSGGADTVEHMTAHVAIKLNNRCRAVPKKYRKYTGYTCDVERGLAPAR